MELDLLSDTKAAEEKLFNALGGHLMELDGDDDELMELDGEDYELVDLASFNNFNNQNGG